MAIYIETLCSELNKLKSPHQCRRALRRHPPVNITGAVSDSSPNIAGAAPARDFTDTAITHNFKLLFSLV